MDRHFFETDWRHLFMMAEPIFKNCPNLLSSIYGMIVDFGEICNKMYLCACFNVSCAC